MSHDGYPQSICVAVRKKSHGFTLIELLTVIAIISVLAAILLPAMASARRSARATACASQMKQIGAAIIMYAQDQNDYLPNTYVAGGLPWYRAVTANCNLEGGGTSYQYKLFRCPERTNYTRPGEADYDPIVRTNYAYLGFVGRMEWYNDWLAGGASWEQLYGPKKLTAVVKPLQALILMDGAGKDYLLQGTDKIATFSFYPTVGGSVHVPNPVYIDPRHNNACNGLFLDGHVVPIPTARWPYDNYAIDWARSSNYEP